MASDNRSCPPACRPIWLRRLSASLKMAGASDSRPPAPPPSEEQERQPEKTKRDSKRRTSCSNPADRKANKRGDPAAKPRSSRLTQPPGQQRANKRGDPAAKPRSSRLTRRVLPSQQPLSENEKTAAEGGSLEKILIDEVRRQPRTEHEPRNREAPATEGATGTGSPKQLNSGGLK
ncbi:Hypothetical predicted protein [Podarcis lilfordi]|uniref:Uncharacterized protein n=1 Tax=Podarcis lilfordi TaxID=74358 RepID=A0AA35KG77_9SAUR|nr:Hypothetical predicted protein [Podarcis lilfordi]